MPVSFLSSLAGRFKPGQLVDFVQRLRKAVDTYDI